MKSWSLLCVFLGVFGMGRLHRQADRQRTNFNTPVQSVGAQIQNNTIGSHFLGEILAYSGSQLLGAFIASAFQATLLTIQKPFWGLQDTTADITSVTYLTFADGSSSSLTPDVGFRG